MVEQIGIVQDVRGFGANWGIATLCKPDRTQIKITGADVLKLTEGETYVICGRIKRHPQHGESLDVASCVVHVHADEKAMAQFIVDHFKGIGITTANKHIKSVLAQQGRAGLEGLRQRLMHQPWLVLDEIKQTTHRQGTLEAHHCSGWVESLVQRDLATRLLGFEQIKPAVIEGLAKFLIELCGSDSDSAAGQVFASNPAELVWAVLARNPYMPIRFVRGYGFAMAEAIGVAQGNPFDDPVRLAALVEHAVDTTCRQYGHVFLEPDALEAVVSKLDPRVDAHEALQLALEAQTVALDAQRVYAHRLLKHERRLAQSLAAMMSSAQPLVSGARSKVQNQIEFAVKKLGDKFAHGLDAGQMQALLNILTSETRLHVVTGGPGCGKTAIMEVLVTVLKGKVMRFASPTGKGAKVLNARIGDYCLSAKTLHSMLRGAVPGEFAFDATNPLDGDVLVIDEAGMLDLGLMRSVMDAVNPSMHVILLGDTDQLPSIGPGRVLYDVLEMQDVDHNCLTTTHRNSGGILELVNGIRQGEVNLTPTDSVWFSNVLAEPSQQFAVVMQTYLEAVKRRGVENVSLLMSRKKGSAGVPGWNTTFANATLREVCNPHGWPIPGTRFHVDDRIIVRENQAVPQRLAGTAKAGDETVAVVNGDTGTIVDAEQVKGEGDGVRDGEGRELVGWLRLALDDGRTLDFPCSQISTLDHAYAMTVHSAQGSEYKEVIAVITAGAPTFINRSTVFTAFSRPKERLMVFAEPYVLTHIAATPAPKRNSGLVAAVERALMGGKSVAFE